MEKSLFYAFFDVEYLLNHYIDSSNIYKADKEPLRLFKNVKLKLTKYFHFP